MAFFPIPVNIPLLLEDASDFVLGALLQPTWGVYLNGTPVIQPANNDGSFPLLAPIAAIASLLGATSIVPASASTVEFEYAQDWPISTYPQEDGAFQAYNKVTLPFEVKLRLAAGGSVSNRQAFLNSCQAIANSFELFDIVTPEMTFTSVSCSHISWRRSATQGATLIQVDMWFSSVPVVSATTFANTQQPGNAGQQAIGAVQPSTPNANNAAGITITPIGSQSQVPSSVISSEFQAGGWN